MSLVNNSRPDLIMEALLSSTLAVSIAEIGDKTQLLALFLVAKYGRPYLISLGVLLSTLLNHALSALFGAWVGDQIPANYIPWIVSAVDRDRRHHHRNDFIFACGRHTRLGPSPQ